MGLKVEFANLAYLKTTDENDTQATDEQYVQERFLLVLFFSSQSEAYRVMAWRWKPSKFIKLEAPYDFLTRYAEILNINMPLRPDLVR